MWENLRHRHRRGFSLVEMITVFTLLATAIGITALSLRRTIDREGPRGLAYAVASDLRAARAEAQRCGSLVAYCLPKGSSPETAFARGAVTRKGEQRGDIYRVHGYKGDFDAAIFVGGWPGSAPDTVPPDTLSSEWTVSLDDQYAIVFRPDGTAFSPNLPLLDGHFPLVTGHGFTLGPTVAGLPSLSQVTDPNLILVSQSGSVSVSEHKTPGAPLPVGGEVPSEVAEIVAAAAPGGGAPTITDIRYLPSRLPGLEPGISQTYTQIHPEQREGADLEYGLATLEIRAQSPSGVPLYYALESTSSGAGGGGQFSDHNNHGRMSYTPRADGSGFDWTAVVAWRPPPGANPDTEYSFRVRVFNDQGLEDIVESGAGLLPVFRTLDSPRLALQDSAGKIYIANIDGASIMEAPGSSLVHDQPPAARIDIRTTSRSIGRDRKVDVVTVRMPFSNHGDPVSEFHNTHAFRSLRIFNADFAAGKGVTMREGETHQATCSTEREPAGSGLISDFAETDGSSQSAQASRSRMTIWRSW